MSEVSSKELYEFKKSLKELAEKKGKGTELVSMYVPPTKQLSDIKVLTSRVKPLVRMFNQLLR